MRINVHHYFEADRETASKLDQILAQLAALTAGKVADMAKLDEYAAQIQSRVDAIAEEVAEQTTLEGSIAALLAGQASQIADLRTQVQQLIDAGDAAAVATLQPVLDALTAQETALRESNDRLLASVTANTPQG